jgi:hypothetical protein
MFKKVDTMILLSRFYNPLPSIPSWLANCPIFSSTISIFSLIRYFILSFFPQGEREREREREGGRVWKNK